ncbi:heterokaryon incompatibility protein-domain-containing protein, partial [Lophiotrema nucula]
MPQLTILKYSKSPQHIRISSPYANPDVIAPRYVQAITSVSNASEACFEIAASWMSECLTEHERCRKTQSTASQMPTRLVELRQSPSSMLRIIRPPGHLAYLTVSHCWGVSDVLKLTKTNLEKLQEGFTENELPQLYRDCIQVARRLGFQYLWLDSLCIIQDSDEDWLEEGWRMGDIYRGSSCTIAAVSCADSTSSLFTKYHPLTNSDLYYPASKGEGILRFPYPYREFAEPLYDRAWVLQERLLSPRTLEYTFAGIGWHCEEMVFHRPDPEMRLEDEEAINVVSPLIDQWRELSNLDISTITNADRLRGQQAWMEVLQTYAMTKLTFESDRPHAINGIISVLQRQTGLEIHAGICADFAPYSLLWSVVWPNEQWRYGQYKCPSWS